MDVLRVVQGRRTKDEFNFLRFHDVIIIMILCTSAV